MTATMTPGQIEQYREFRRRGGATLRAKHDVRAAAIFEDLEFMLSTGETLERSLSRLGTNYNALYGLAKRRARHDIIELLRGGAL